MALRSCVTCHNSALEAAQITTALLSIDNTSRLDH
jgi:hypothetical protein